MPVLVLAIVGVIGIVAGVITSRIAKKRLAASPKGPFSKWLPISSGLGLALAVASWPLTWFMGYPYANDLGRPGRVVGVPFFVAYFDHLGADFVGPLTLPATLANSVFWAYFPRIVVVAYFSVREFTHRPTVPS